MALFCEQNLRSLLVASTRGGFWGRAGTHVLVVVVYVVLLLFWIYGVVWYGMVWYDTIQVVD